MPMYDCTVFALAEGEIYPAATFPFDHESQGDPLATFTFGLGRHRLTDLADAATRDRLTAGAAPAAWAYVTSRGGLVDPDIVESALELGLAALAQGVSPEPAGYVFGSTYWGDICLDRVVTEAWAETARLLKSEITWAELCHRLPAFTREDVIETCLEWWLPKYEDEESDDLPAGAVEDWSDGISDEGGSWPWLATIDYQAYPTDVPESLRELIDESAVGVSTGDGEYYSWEDADDLIVALTEAGVGAVRDDTLIDRAMGPFGRAFWGEDE